MQALPFSDALKLLAYLKDWTLNPDKVSGNIAFICSKYLIQDSRCNVLITFVFQVELVCRIATVLLQTHYNQLVSTPAARPVLTVLKELLYTRIKVVPIYKVCCP